MYVITEDDYLSMNPGRSECAVMLRRCLAIVLRKEGCQGNPGDFWMYESGYLLFQGLLSANSVCWWNSALNGATKTLEYRGYISPGAILVNSEPCALEVLRGAWARRVLQPPAGYQIVSLEDIEDCTVTSVMQTQWTPLPEAVCAVILRLSSQGRPAGIETIREALMLTFPHVSPPSERVLYDTLVQLKAERKLYHTSRGYFIVTPERRRSRSYSRSRGNHRPEEGSKGMLMSTEEALALAHGEMFTLRDGDVTHQCIQTNLADVICGGNPSDKVLYSRNFKRRSASFPAPKSPDRRGSFKLWSSTRRLRRSASTRTIARHQYTDSSSSTEYPNSSDSAKTPKKESLLSRLFRRSRRSQTQIQTFSAQFPPSEWFNSKAVHLHSVGTQTTSTVEDIESYPSYCLVASESTLSKSATLPRRHRRQLSNDSTAYVTSHTESRDHSPSLRYRSQAFGSLPRNVRNQLSPNKSYDSSRKTSRSSLSPKINHPSNESEEPKLSPQIKSLQSLIRNGSKASSKESLKNISLIGSDDKFITIESSECKINGKSGESLSSSPFKTFSSVDNSGPSSLESHKSSKAGSSITSGTSSLESHKTVIQRTGNAENKSYFLENKSYTMDNKSYSTDNKTYLTDNKSYSTDNKSYATDNKLYSADNKSYLTDNKSYSIDNKSYSTDNKSYQTDSRPYSINYKPYSTDYKPYSMDTKSYSIVDNKSYTTDNKSCTTEIKDKSIYSSKKSPKRKESLKSKQTPSPKPTQKIIPKSNSFTLQVTTNQGGLPSTNNAISPTNTKIYVQNSPVCSVITFENGQSPDKSNLVIINGSEPVLETPNLYQSKPVNNDLNSQQAQSPKYSKNTNHTQGKENSELMNNSQNVETPKEPNGETMNNSRKLSLQMPNAKDGLSYQNFLKNVSSPPCNQFKSNSTPDGISITRNSFSSNPSSPIINYDDIQDAFSSKISLDKSFEQMDKNILSSDPNISSKEDLKDNLTNSKRTIRDQQFPSLSDLSFNFTSLAAQKILKGVSINSIDTLVELNMAANGDRKNNCDVVHTDFGLV